MKNSVARRSSWLRISLAALVVVGVGIGAWMLVHRAHESPDHNHGHNHEAASVMTLNNGQRWETDQPLRTGMQRIRDAVEQTFTAHASGRLTMADTKALSATVQENVNYLIENCKLSPEADAVLHVLITEMLSSAAQLAQNPTADEGLEQMAQALHNYSEYFDHPGWIELDAPK